MYFRLTYVPEGLRLPRTVWARELESSFVARRGRRCFRVCSPDGRETGEQVFVGPVDAAAVVPARFWAGRFDVVSGAGTGE